MLLTLPFLVAGCSLVGGATPVKGTDLTAHYTVDQATGSALVSVESAACGIVASGEIRLNAGPAACAAVNSAQGGLVPAAH